MNSTTIKYIIAIMVASFLFACTAEAKQFEQHQLAYCNAAVYLKPSL